MNTSTNIRKIFFVLLFFIAASCSSRNKLESENSAEYGGRDYVDSLVAKVEPKWFKTTKAFSLRNLEGQAKPHFFFDVNPKVNKKTRSMNVVITNVEGSGEVYNLDLTSGQFIYDRKLCKDKDFWEKYKKSITTPPFSIGVVPRYLDQLGSAQKVIVFGEKTYLEKYHKTHFFDVKVIGGYVEKECRYGSCVDLNQWSSRLVLIAIRKGSKELKDVNNLNELMKVVDWPYVKAFLENGQGKNKIASKNYGAYKVSHLVSASRAVDFFMKNSTFFSYKKMISLQKSCYHLYQHYWKVLSQSKDKKSYRKNFYSLFHKNHLEFKTCSKYVYPFSINSDFKRYWDFNFIIAYYKLHELGYSYRCGSEAWIKNLRMPDGKLMYPVEKELYACSSKEIKAGMKKALHMFKSLYQRDISTYRFVEYDKKTHGKVYSLVFQPNKYSSCEKEQKDFFPRDIKL
ncbi:MAG: hypothetical protein N4A33_03855 [Bacteriovoracaceae bacterium]|jgi:hypothetical protein|nr:hypothetical protein [Bacteriovoracaceae bacterium]